VGRCQQVAHISRRRRSRFDTRRCGARSKFFPGQVRPTDALGEALPSRDGGAWTGTAPLGKRRRRAGAARGISRTHAEPTDQQGHGVESELRRHRFHRADV